MYENKHYPIGPASPIEAIKFRMEQQGLSQRDLEPCSRRSCSGEKYSREAPPQEKMLRHHTTLNRACAKGRVGQLAPRYAFRFTL